MKNIFKPFQLIANFNCLPKAKTNSNSFLRRRERATSLEASITLVMRGIKSFTVIMKRFL